MGWWKSKKFNQVIHESDLPWVRVLYKTCGPEFWRSGTACRCHARLSTHWKVTWKIHPDYFLLWASHVNWIRHYNENQLKKPFYSTFTWFWFVGFWVFRDSSKILSQKLTSSGTWQEVLKSRCAQQQWGRILSPNGTSTSTDISTVSPAPTQSKQNLHVENKYK